MITRFPAQELLVTGKGYVRGADFVQSGPVGGTGSGNGAAATAADRADDFTRA